MMVWWGIWLLCIADFTDANEYATVLCPLYISGLLLFVSGVPTVEPEQQKRYGHLREYWQWRLGTSKYVPMPPSWYYSVLPYNDDDVEEGMSAMHAHGQHP
jgi:steroid 5-alpha reductase family enzyme